LATRTTARRWAGLGPSGPATLTTAGPSGARTRRTGSPPGLPSCRSRPLRREEHTTIEAGEVEAVDAALVYDDAPPALDELAGLGVRLIVASSLSENALSRFLDRTGWRALFHDRWSRDAAGGVGDVVIRRVVTDGSLAADRVLFLADTEAGLRAATLAGVRPILMMNDPDEAMRLTAYNPAGGIVSLHELPDLVRLVAARQANRESTTYKRSG